MIKGNLPRDDRYYMHFALKEAEKAKKKDEVPVGCVIVQNDRIIARAHNLKEHRKSALMHAEILAIMRASRRLKRWRLSDCTLFVTLEPCPMCMGAAISARFNRVVYGASDPKGGACGSMYNINQGGLNHTVAVTGGVTKDACAEILSNYFRGKRK
ncbi:MAG: tRNA adenosine(34) deaminase TadA [Eubacteriales bacterium]